MKLKRDKHGDWYNSTKSYRWIPHRGRSYTYAHCFRAEVTVRDTDCVFDNYKVVFNEYKPSVTSAKHMGFDRAEHGGADIFIDVPGCSLDDKNWLQIARDWYTDEITRSEIKLKNAKHGATRAKCERMIGEAKDKLAELSQL
jgi:hypothetical protein